MPLFKNTNPVYGHSGPFEAESKQVLVNEMEETLRNWAREKYYRLSDYERMSTDRDTYEEEAIDIMRSEFELALEEYG